VEIYTIGFAKKSAEEFFGALKRAGIRRLIDVRLNNTSQLAGFTKRGDLPYFLRALCGTEYFHVPDLAPPKELLDGFKKGQVSWEEYEARFRAVLDERRVEERVGRGYFEGPAVLLCSEEKPDSCHRRLVAERLAGVWGDVKIIHL